MSGGNLIRHLLRKPLGLLLNAAARKPFLFGRNTGNKQTPPYRFCGRLPAALVASSSAPTCRVRSFAPLLATLPVFVLLLVFSACSSAAQDNYICPTVGGGMLGPGEAVIIGHVGRVEEVDRTYGRFMDIWSKSPVTTIRILRPFNASIPQHFTLLQRSQLNTATGDYSLYPMPGDWTYVLQIRKTSQYGANFELMARTACRAKSSADN